MKTDHSDSSFAALFRPLTDRKIIQLIILIGFVVYFYIFFNGFVWDDITYIIQNPELHRFDLSVLLGPNTFNSSGYFRPLPAVYFSLLYGLFGRTAFFYHFFQLAGHIACTILLYYIFRHFFPVAISFFLSLVFLVHPVNVESVAYIGSSQSQMYFFFGGLAFLLSLSKSLTSKKIILIHLLLAAALFTKEVSVLYFFIIYSFRFISRQKIPPGLILASFATMALYLPVRLAVLGKMLHRMQLIPISELPFFERLLHIPAVFFYYLKTFFFPRTLAINQIWTMTGINWPEFYLPLFFSLLFILGLFWGLYKTFSSIPEQFPQYLFFLLWFLAGMGFLIQIFPLDMTVADRWFYFPLVGLLGILGTIFSRLQINRKHLWLAGLILVLLSFRTMIRTTDWHNALVLYSRDAGKFDNYDLENNLGAELAFSGDFAAALPHFLKSVRLWPHDTNLYNAGTAFEKLQDYPNAIIYYRRAIAIENDFPVHDQVRLLATEGLAKMLLLHDTPGNADIFISRAVRDYPDNGTLWAYLAIIHYRLDLQQSALTAAARADSLLSTDTSRKLYRIIIDRRPMDLRLE